MVSFGEQAPQEADVMKNASTAMTLARSLIKQIDIQTLHQFTVIVLSLIAAVRRFLPA
jgi:hypothetical protein